MDEKIKIVTYVGINGGGNPPGRIGGGATPLPGTFGAGRPGGGGAPRLGFELGGGGRFIVDGFGLFTVDVDDGGGAFDTLLLIGVGDGAILRHDQSSLIGGGAG